jgi:hypothetical protein
MRICFILKSTLIFVKLEIYKIRKRNKVLDVIEQFLSFYPIS